MPSFTKIFIVPINPTSTSEISVFNSVINRLVHYYSVKPVGLWFLDERHFRETAEIPPKDGRHVNEEAKAPTSLKTLQALTMSNEPNLTYFVTTEKAAPAQSQPNTPATANPGHESNVRAPIITAMVSGPDCEALLFVFRSRMQPLWDKHQSLVVNNGQAFEIEDFKVRVGEVRAGTGGAVQAKEVLVEVEWHCGEEDDAEVAEAVLSAFWKELNVTSARQQSVKAVRNKKYERIIQWCEALRLH